MGLLVKAELEIFMLEKGHRMPSILELEKGCFPDRCSVREFELLSLSCPPRRPKPTGVPVLFKGSSGH